MEFRNVASRWQLDPHRIPLCPPVGIVLCQPAAHFVGLHPNHSIVGSVVVERPAEHFSPNHALSQTVQAPGEGVPDDQAQKILRSLGARERFAG